MQIFHEIARPIQTYQCNFRDADGAAHALWDTRGYYGLICASHFGRMVPAITVQMMPL